MVVNDDRRALDLTHFALDAVQFVAVEHAHPFGQSHAIVFFGLIGHHVDALCAFGPHAHGDLHHAVAFRALAHLLATGHGHCVVVQNLVGDVDARRNALADCQNAAVKVGAVTQVGKDVLLVAERLLTCPGHALAAHLGEADGAAVHPDAHEVAANARHGTRAFRHLGGGVVWAARAEPRLSVCRCPQRQCLHGLFLAIEHGQVGVDLSGGICINPQFLQALGNRPRNDGGRQIGVGAQQGALSGVGDGPFTTRHIAVGFVELTQDVGSYIVTPVVELFLELVFDDLAFFLDHQNFAQTRGKLARCLRFQRPDHRHFVQTDAQLSATVVI